MRQPLVTFVRRLYSSMLPSESPKPDQDRSERAFFPTQAALDREQGARHIATGCLAGTSETKPPREAGQAPAVCIARKYQPERLRRGIEDIDCADVLSISLNDVGEPGVQFEIEARIDRLNDFWAARNYRRLMLRRVRHTSNIVANRVANAVTLRAFAPRSTITPRKASTGA